MQKSFNIEHQTVVSSFWCRNYRQIVSTMYNERVVAQLRGAFIEGWLDDNENCELAEKMPKKSNTLFAR